MTLSLNRPRRGSESYLRCVHACENFVCWDHDKNSRYVQMYAGTYAWNDQAHKNIAFRPNEARNTARNWTTEKVSHTSDAHRSDHLAALCPGPFLSFCLASSLAKEIAFAFVKKRFTLLPNPQRTHIYMTTTARVKILAQYTRSITPISHLRGHRRRASILLHLFGESSSHGLTHEEAHESKSRRAKDCH